MCLSPVLHFLDLLFCLDAVFLIKLIYAASCAYSLLLAGVERMALRTDLDVYLLVCGTCNECVAAVAGNCCLIVLRMYSFSHFFLRKNLKLFFFFICFNLTELPARLTGRPVRLYTRPVCNRCSLKDPYGKAFRKTASLFYHSLKLQARGNLIEPCFHYLSHKLPVIGCASEHVYYLVHHFIGMGTVYGAPDICYSLHLLI